MTYNEHLIEAAKNGDLAEVIRLVEAGADIHADDNDSLCMASGYGHLAVVQYLVEHGADVQTWDNAPLRWASQNGHLAVVKYLVEQGADIHARDNCALRLAIENEHHDVVDYLKSISSEKTINEKLIEAARKGNLAEVIRLVEAGADIHAEDNDSLCWASRNGHLAVVQYLVEHGADVKAIDNYSLRLATENGHHDVVEYLSILSEKTIESLSEEKLSHNGHETILEQIQKQMNEKKTDSQYVFKTNTRYRIRLKINEEIKNSNSYFSSLASHFIEGTVCYQDDYFLELTDIKGSDENIFRKSDIAGASIIAF